MDTKIVGYRSEKSLSVVQFATPDQDTFHYVSAANALRQNSIEVKELNDTGSVNSLLVLNHSAAYVFLMDGDILAGAKQNRVINTSILLAPESKTQIPVSCVESGRWRHVSANFSATDYTAPSALRMEKARQVRSSLKAERGFTSDQGAVWNKVSDYQMRSDVRSATSNLSDIYQEKGQAFDAVISAFAPDPAANGLTVFVGKRLLSLDAFNRRDIFREYFPKILRGVALEVYHRKESEKPAGEAEAKYRTLDFFDDVESLPWEAYKAVAAGTERRFDTGALTGFQLEHTGRMIHLTALGAEHETRWH